MKKILLIFIVAFFSFQNTVFAISKNDILNYVENIEVCDEETSQLFNSYSILFSRMLTEKKLDDNQLEQIMNNLKNAVNILQQYNVCKKNDFNVIPIEIQNQIQNYLYDGAMIIYDAEPINPNDTNNIGGNIVIDRNNNTINIYQNGSLTDKIELNSKKFNYVGLNKLLYKYLALLLVIAIICLTIIFIIKKKNFYYKKIFQDLSISLLIISSILFLSIFIFRGKLTFYIDIIDMLSKPISNNEKEIVLNENNEIISYPAYGNNYATLKIKNLDIDLPVKFGDSKDILAQSIGHTSTSYLPGEGGTIVYSGHNSTKFLANLKDIKKDDLIEITTSYGYFEYQVTDIKIMNEDEYYKLKIDKISENLILYTCYPFDNILYSKERYVVFADLSSSEWVIK